MTLDIHNNIIQRCQVFDTSIYDVTFSKELTSDKPFYNRLNALITGLKKQIQRIEDCYAYSNLPDGFDLLEELIFPETYATLQESKNLLKTIAEHSYYVQAPMPSTPKGQYVQVAFTHILNEFDDKLKFYHLDQDLEWAKLAIVILGKNLVLADITIH